MVVFQKRFGTGATRWRVTHFPTSCAGRSQRLEFSRELLSYNTPFAPAIANEHAPSSGCTLRRRVAAKVRSLGSAFVLADLTRERGTTSIYRHSPRLSSTSTAISAEQSVNIPQSASQRLQMGQIRCRELVAQ